MSSRKVVRMKIKSKIIEEQNKDTLIERFL